MTIQQLEITDIFRSAYLLCSGGDLSGVRIKKGGKPIASFLIKGEGLDRLDRAYRSGEALVNPLQLRESLNHLRDVMFDKLRKSDPASPKATPGQEGRARNDHRKRDHRAGQAY